MINLFRRVIKFFWFNADYYLGRFQWYRKWVGGDWYFVTPKPFPYMEFWSRYAIPDIEIVWQEEHYA